MDRLQLDKNAKLTGRVYFKDEVMWLGLSGSGASFTFDGTKLVLKLKGDNIAVGDNPIDYARIAVYVDGKRVVDEMIDCAEKEVTVIDRTENAQSVVEIIKLSESPLSAVHPRINLESAHRAAQAVRIFQPAPQYFFWLPFSIKTDPPALNRE